MNAFSPTPESTYHSPSQPLILPSLPTRRKSKPNTTNNNNNNNTINNNKRRKSSNLINHHHHHQRGEEEPGGEDNSPANGPDGEIDHEDEDQIPKELNDDDYSIRKREDLLNKDRLKILLEHFDPQQMDRYTEYRNSGLAKANIRKLANTILQQSVTDRVTIVIRGFAKVFVGHMVESALDIQKKRGGSGPISQADLKEAYRLHLLERDRPGSDRKKLFINSSIIVMKKKGGSSRFPVARIKKIMQADEDVGKVAQATPLLVSKAVEMFMQSLVEAAVTEAQQRGSRKVQAYHLKQAIQITPAFDFLKDIVAKIPDPVHGGPEDPECSTTTASASDAKKRASTGSAGKHKEIDDNESDGDPESGGDDEEYYYLDSYFFIASLN
ncbi:hypothetical protein H4Q26_007504 [Puccinia striiformis f. sp. tritici PST-130]|nr:hypothetical protein H4Q26_007504 [Puccinia striiformis f. sp. tritici PST-130]